ncbi:MAG: 50S ribosomal protein L4 [Nanoarchaeota archaeon]|nr:50S ribosomal protein L4 [Nanoarchaeota archaeon]
MKTKILTIQGKTEKEIELPKCFSSNIREDITQKYFEAMKKIQPYAPSILAGKMYSASGIVSHMRHKWKTAYGHGISRVPRKILWRRGTQFNWQGATIASAVGGRPAHPPKIKHFLKQKKINKKEIKIAITSAISSTANSKFIEKRYERVNQEIQNLPLVVESKILKLKTKDLLEFLKKILSENYKIAIKEKKKNAGKGKLRGRRYKSNAGLLFVTGNKENLKIKAIEVKKVRELEISDLWPLGRLTIYTESAIQDLSKLWEKEK